MYYYIDKVETGKRIKELAEERGITPKIIRDEIFLGTKQAVYRWYRGETLPSIDSLFLLSQLLDVPIDCILIGKKHD